jgi:hypothetical protein
VAVPKWSQRTILIRQAFGWALNGPICIKLAIRQTLFFDKKSYKEIYKNSPETLMLYIWWQKNRQ